MHKRLPRCRDYSTEECLVHLRILGRRLLCNSLFDWSFLFLLRNIGRFDLRLFLSRSDRVGLFRLSHSVGFVYSSSELRNSVLRKLVDSLIQSRSLAQDHSEAEEQVNAGVSDTGLCIFQNQLYKLRADRFENHGNLFRLLLVALK